MHLNGFVDVTSKAFLDVVIQPGQHPDERAAMRSMLSHFSPDEPEKYIITVDRGYESYDLIFQCELKKLNYVFRLKAPSSGRSILSSFSSEIPDDQEEFDVTVKRFFTDKYNKIMKEQGDVYHYMNPYKTIPIFRKLLACRHLHYLQFRVVKIKTAENTYEYLITNLPFSFDLNDIKEIYANLILYNFGIFLANETADENRRQKRKTDNKYTYEVDISTALKLARKYFIRGDTGQYIDIIKLMTRYVHAVKTEFRQFDRALRGIGAIHFGYR